VPTQPHITEVKPTWIYLDQNKWIDLSRAYHSRKGGEHYRRTLEAARKAVVTNRARFPLASNHFIETQRSSDPDKRARLAQVMAKISQGWTLAPSKAIVPTLIQLEIAKVFNKCTSVEKPQIYGKGVHFAFGEIAEVSSELDNAEFMKSVLQLLISPSVVELTLRGIDEGARTRTVKQIDSSAGGFAQRIEQSRKISKSLSKTMRRRVYVAELTTILSPEIYTALESIDLHFSDFLSLGKHRMTEFIRSIPPLDVEIELFTERNEHWDRQIDANDTRDIDFLSVAIPYCGVVVTELFWVSIAKRTGLDRKYGTIMLSDLAALPNYLEQ
jgi:hypothetical protein